MSSQNISNRIAKLCTSLALACAVGSASQATAAADDVKKLEAEVKKKVGETGRVDSKLQRQFFEAKFGKPDKPAKMLAPSLVKSKTSKASTAVDKSKFSAESNIAISSSSQQARSGPAPALPAASGICSIEGAPEGLGFCFNWDRVDNEILLYIAINPANPIGMPIYNLHPGDQIILGNVSGVAGFSKDTGSPKLAGVVGLLAAGGSVASTIAGCPECAVAIGKANEYAQEQFKGTGKAEKHRNGFGVDPGSGHKARQEGGIIACPPSPVGLPSSGNDDNKKRWIKQPGDRGVSGIPDHAAHCFFPEPFAPVTGGTNVRTVTYLDPVTPTLWLGAWDHKYDDNTGFYTMFVRIQKAGFTTDLNPVLLRHQLPAGAMMLGNAVMANPGYKLENGPGNQVMIKQSGTGGTKAGAGTLSCGCINGIGTCKETVSGPVAVCSPDKSAALACNGSCGWIAGTGAGLRAQ